jgi:hypothetical protein
MRLMILRRMALPVFARLALLRAAVALPLGRLGAGVDFLSLNLGLLLSQFASIYLRGQFDAFRSKELYQVHISVVRRVERL